VAKPKMERITWSAACRVHWKNQFCTIATGNVGKALCEIGIFGAISLFLSLGEQRNEIIKSPIVKTLYKSLLMQEN